MAKIHDKNLVFIDIETTGLSMGSHEIIEIALIQTNPKLEVMFEWHSKAKPAFPEWADKKALEVNGYTEQAWKNAPLFIELVSKIREIMKGAICVAHNAPFDKKFLMKALNQHSSDEAMRGIGYHWLDTITLAYLAFPGIDSLSLSSLCTHLDISNEGAHTALADARRCREVFIRSVKCLKGIDVPASKWIS